MSLIVEQIAKLGYEVGRLYLIETEEHAAPPAWGLLTDQIMYFDSVNLLDEDTAATAWDIHEQWKIQYPSFGEFEDLPKSRQYAARLFVAVVRVLLTASHEKEPS